MPNTHTRRLENCYMPPKKSAWRFAKSDLPDHSVLESQFVESETIRNREMGLMSDDSQVKPADRIQVYPTIEQLSQIQNVQYEEAPLDFSVKKVSHSIKKSESSSKLTQSVKYELNGSDNIVNHHHPALYHHTKMLNGNITPPSPPKNDSPAMVDTSRISPSSKDSDSMDMDSSQEFSKSPSRSVGSCASTINEIDRNCSPNNPSVSRENSPVGQASILEGMLRNQQQSNIGMPNATQPFMPGYGNGLGIFQSQMIASPSPPMAMNAPVMLPTNMLPLTMAQYFGYGYAEHANSFMPGYVYKHPEPSMSDISSTCKSKKKADPLTDSLKSYSIDELRKKLDTLSGGGTIFDPDYSASMKSTYIPQRRNGGHFSNTIPDIPKNSVNNGPNNCSTVSTSQNGEITNGTVSHNNGNVATIGDMKINENNTLVTGNHNGTVANNIASASHADDANNSLPNGMPGSSSSPDDRRRKSIDDYKNDPQYRMKRAKNNLAARRSRESRRIKEELIRKTAGLLEQQNKVIMRDLNAMKLSYDEAQVKYFALLKEYENMKIHNSVLVERLNQKRCGQCGSALPNVQN